jgi:site-specific recombinase XerD
MSVPNYIIYLYLRKDRPSKDGKFPIYVRLTLNNQRLQNPTGQYIDADFWDDKQQKAVRTNEAATINSMLTAVKGEIDQAISHLYISRAELSIDSIRQVLNGEAVQEEQTFIKVAHEHNDAFEKLIGKKYSKGSYKNYKTTLKYLKEFVPKYCGKKDMALKAVNFRFCEAYFTYLTTEKKCHVNGANKQLQRVKKIINYAIRHEYLQTNPMATFTLEFTPVNKVALTLDEMSRLAKLNLNRQVLQDVRDVFLVQCFTGLSYSDIKQLTRAQVLAGENGSLWIRMKRQKTNVSFAVPVLPAALDILSKYLSNAALEAPLLPVISNQKMNDNLKVLQELAGIPKNLTTHLARHSFATSVTLSNGVPIETVSRMLGHTKLSTTQIYAKVLDTKIGADMQLLSERLSRKEQKNDS